MRAFRRCATRIVLCLVASVSSAAVAEDTFDVEFTGMVATAKKGTSEDAPRVALLVNSDSTVGGVEPMIQHAPKLELRCSDLADAQLQESCRVWQKAPCGRRSLDLSEGWEVSFEFSSPPLDTPNVLQTSEDFEELVVHGGHVSDGIVGAETLRQEALDPATGADFALVRAFLDRGKLLAIPAEPNYGEWKFKTSWIAKSKRTYPSVAAHLLWRRRVADGTTATIKLTPDSGMRSPIYIQLLASASRVVLSNEPDDDQFCEHAPKNALSPYTHFIHFWGLTVVDPKKLSKLPLPYSSAPSQQCKAMDKGMGMGMEMAMAVAASDAAVDICALGRHTDCMMFSLDKIQP